MSNRTNKELRIVEDTMKTAGQSEQPLNQNPTSSSTTESKPDTIDIQVSLIPTAVLRNNWNVCTKGKIDLDSFAESIGIDRKDIKKLPTTHLAMLVINILIIQLEHQTGDVYNPIDESPTVNTTTEPGVPDGFIETQNDLYDRGLIGPDVPVFEIKEHNE